jgi:hypothetical protein
MSKTRLFLIVQALLCILVAAVLAVLTVRTFIEGSAWQAAGHPSDWIYTREKAGGALLAVLPLFCVSAAMTVIGVVKGIKDEEAEKPVQDAELARNLMCARVAEPSAEMLRERELQKKLLIAGVAGFGACMIPILLYVTNSTHFAQTDPEGLDQSLIALVRFTAPWALAGLACLTASTFLQGKSMQREFEAAQARIRTEKEAGIVKDLEAVQADARLYHTDPETVKRRVLTRRILMAAAILFIVIGIFNGSMKDVLVKAIKICTECVGLG